jgi:tetratricopeptide (TPR) repeat protein
MILRRLAFTLGLLLLPAGACLALDVVKTTAGAVSGKVVGISPYKVELQQGASGAKKEISANQIILITFEGEPFSLKTAKTMIAVEHRYQEGLSTLNKVKPDELGGRKELRQELEFYRALAEARQALDGLGPIAEAGKKMLAFANDNATSYHYLDACETIGDLLMANRSFAEAEKYYGKLARSPWPEVQMKAGVAIGYAQLDQGKTGEAMKSFEAALAAPGGEESPVQAQRNAAQLGKAAVLTAMKKPGDAVALVDAMLQKADPDDGKLIARAYNTLGNAYRQSGKPKEAVLAFLKTHLLFPAASPEAHAEALYNLAELWEQLHKPERAVEAGKILAEKYPNSPWTEKTRQ